LHYHQPQREDFTSSGQCSVQSLIAAKSVINATHVKQSVLLCQFYTRRRHFRAFL